jgi:hypothetical protein
MALNLPNSELQKITAAAVKQPAFIKSAKSTIKKEFLEIQKEFLDAFDNHPVTQEIAGGPSATNISKTLSGVGNLFTYIGFSIGENPIRPLRKVLEKYEINFHPRKNFLMARIELPTKQEVFAVTPMPWATGRSWARGIERGISGLGKYLVKDTRVAKSKSGFAIQAKSKVRNGKFSNVPYLSTLLNDYYKKIKNLERKAFS